MTIPAAATAPAAPVPATLDPEGRIARQRGPWLRVVPEPRLALVLLSEHLNRWEIVGAIAIAAGIVLERLRARGPVGVPAE